MAIEIDLHPVEREIDGNRYRYQPLMLQQARQLFDLLVKQFGSGVSDAVAALKDLDVTDDEELADAIGKATASAGALVGALVRGLDEATHTKVAGVIAAQTQIHTGEGFAPLTDVREQLFGKHLMTEFKVIALGLEAQYSDFLVPLRSLSHMAVALRARAGSTSASPSPSTGSPSESQPAPNSPTASQILNATGG